MVKLARILDLDGALLDSEPWHKRAEQETLGEMGLAITEAELHRFTGVTMAAMLDVLSKEQGREFSLEEFLSLHRPRLLGYVNNDMHLHDDATEFLLRLSSPIALATNSMRWYVEPVTAKFFPDIVFAAVVCVDDVANGKPSPDSFILAAELMDTAPSDCIAVEDSVSGVASAKSAGCYVVAVQRDKRIDLSEADVVVSSLSEITVTP